MPQKNISIDIRIIGWLASKTDLERMHLVVHNRPCWESARSSPPNKTVISVYFRTIDIFMKSISFMGILLPRAEAWAFTDKVVGLAEIAEKRGILPIVFWEGRSSLLLPEGRRHERLIEKIVKKTKALVISSFPKKGCHFLPSGHMAPRNWVPPPPRARSRDTVLVVGNDIHLDSEILPPGLTIIGNIGKSSTYIPKPGLYYKLANFKLGLLPITRSGYGYPMKLSDYIAAGLPVLAVKGQWWAKLVEEWGGMVVSREEFKEAAQSLIQSPITLEEMYYRELERRDELRWEKVHRAFMDMVSQHLSQWRSS